MTLRIRSLAALLTAFVLGTVAAVVLPGHSPMALAGAEGTLAPNGKAKFAPMVQVLPAATGDCRFVVADGENLTLWAVRDNRLDYLDGYMKGVIQIPRESWQQITQATAAAFAQKFPALLSEIKRKAASGE